MLPLFFACTIFISFFYICRYNFICMAENNSFDRLVTGLSDSERKDLLEKMQAGAGSQNTASMHSVDDYVELGNFAEQIKQESIFLRIWLWLKSIFTNSGVEELYNERKIAYIARRLNKTAPDLIDYGREIILSSFYNKLVELKLCADFFRPYLAAIDDNDGDFYVFLGSFMMEQVTQEMDKNVDPYSNSIEVGAKPEVRMGLLRKMDDILSTISQNERRGMYAAVRSVEWIKNFCHINFTRMMNYFTSLTDGVNTCSFGSIAGELGDFAKVMCNGIPVQEAVLEALYLFSIKKRHVIADETPGATPAREFIEKAHAQLSMIDMFIQTVPLKLLCCVVFNDVNPNIGTFTGGEDWYAKYKAKWKKLFDQKWSQWSNDCKKENLRHSLTMNFKLENFPVIPNRPWKKMWGSGIHFRYELTGGFLLWYFKETFQTHELTLKTLMLEGDFVKKDNRVEFTDSFNALVQVSIDLANFGRRVSDAGDIGVLLGKLGEEKMRTIQGAQKAESVMRSAESDMASIIIHFGDAVRIIELCLAGVFGERTDSRYDGLTNLNHVQGHQNEEFKVKLKEARESLGNALEMLKELEPVDGPNSVR